MNQTLLELLYRSFDEQLSPAEQQQLEAALAASQDLQKEKEKITALRKAIHRNAAESFEPFFSDRVMRRIYAENDRESANENDFFDSLLWAFRRIALVGAVGAVLLFAVNLSRGEELSLDSALAMPQLSLEDAWELEILAEAE